VQLWLSLAALGAGLFPLVVRLGAAERARGSGLAWAIAVLALSCVALAARPKAGASAAELLPAPHRDQGYVGSGACRSCHPEEHASWHRSFHRTMTQVANAGTVLAPWNGVALEVAGRSVELFRRDEQYWARLPDPDLGPALALPAAMGRGSDAPRVERRVVMTTGSHHYQAYWVAGSRGRELIELPVVYHLEAARFIPRQAAFLQPPDAEPVTIRWNGNCVQCHSVAGQPRHDLLLDRFDTRAVELGIACESCHGPGERHAERHQNPLARYAARRDGEADATIIDPRRLDAGTASAICGQCHAYFVPRNEEQWWQSGFSESFRAGDSLEPSRQLLSYDSAESEAALIDTTLDSLFWDDGTMRVGGREYSAMIESACFTRGHGDQKLGCLSCHSMHESDPDDQLAEGMRTDGACTQCHADVAARLTDHTGHSASSSGSRCYNCHMPYTSYALFKAIRSHRIDSPSIEGIVSSTKPNACNLCHLDRSLEWTLGELARRKREGADVNAALPAARGGSSAGGVEAAHADGMALDVQGTRSPHPAAAASWLFTGDAALRVVVAAAMGREAAHAASGDGWQALALAPLLDDPYAAVRFVAHRSLGEILAARTPPHTAKPARDVVAGYDFIAERSERRQAARDVAARLSPNGTRAGQRALGPLLDAGGRLDADTLFEWQQRRDDRPVTIAE